MRTILFVFLLLPVPLLAAFEARIIPGEDVARVVVMLSSRQESINAVEGTLTVGQGATVSRIYTGGSVIGSWIESPREENGSIRFAGIIPGGFTGSAVAGKGLTGAAELFSFEVTGPTDAFNIEDAAVYVNDGAGTKVRVPDGAIITYLSSGSPRQEEDRLPPEYVEVVTDTSLVPGKMALTIYGFDAQSGIDRYEVQEGKGGWLETREFYEVRDTSGLLSISVRAYDRAGNFIETRIEGKNVAWAKLLFLGVVLLLILAGSALLVYFKKRRIKKT